MTSVAFFRNLNQGQRGHPTAAQLVDAFVRCGAVDVRPVRSNGTVIFEAEDAQRCLDEALALLDGVSAWGDVAFTREGDWLAARASELPAGIVPALVELSLLDDGRTLSAPMPMRGKGCAVVVAGPGYAITVNDTPGTSQATPTLEKALATPVTSRSASTLHLLLDAV